ncbi:MAG TPA: alanine--tRNA ligase [Patescibacteria group bacterium]|nr:alanine--tRNA ligase [Patescibacteria group bacterium]
MTSKELRKKYLDFFREKGHKVLPSASLIPENDPTTLFISAGMHPLVPYLLGEPHPLGKRLASVQKCLRTVDIDEVGDTCHQTFFEMMGNWSLGDYWKKEMIPWSYEFMTKVMGIPEEKISVTCFAGDEDAPRDDETAALWEKVGIPKERIYFLGKKDNWWGPAGKIGPCGPDSEMYYDTGEEACGPDCRPGCGCGKYLEFWNDVFMQYNCTAEGRFEPLKQKNIDTGMGVERMLMVMNNEYDAYRTDVLWPIVQKIEGLSGLKYGEKSDEEYIKDGKQCWVDVRKRFRIIADHIRAATFLIADGIIPSNTEQGYVLRRLIRRAIRFGKMLGIEKPFATEVAESVMETMGEVYPEIIQEKVKILAELSKEEERFSKTLSRGIKEFEKIIGGLPSGEKLPGKTAFFLYETFGFPIELTAEMAKEKDINVNEAEFDRASAEHQKLSRAGAEKKFAGGLADQSEQVVKYHTATHLLHAALRQVLGSEVHQVGSNLTAERLRFDFTWPEKLTEEQIKEVEDLVNEQIEKDLPVTAETMGLAEAKEKGALAFFEQKYAEQVKVYTIGELSKEVCGGPHAERTGVLGRFKITKEESSGAGKRRIYAILE